MRVLLCIRKNYLTNFAGDSVQVLKTYDYLKNKGVDVDINENGEIDFSKYNIIHIFNLMRVNETYKWYKLAKLKGCIITISPIYWDLTKYYIHSRNSEYLDMWERNRAYRSEMLRGCNMVFPASYMEMEILKKEFRYEFPYKIIYNGVDIHNLDNCIDTDTKCISKKPIVNVTRSIGSYILCAARICPRKNQLLLSEVCNMLGLRLVLAGPINNKEYLNKCLEYKNVVYIGFLNKNELYWRYKSAKLHVLPSFVETPGLSSLEAAACGCNVVSTIEGSAKEYFGNMANFCDPYNKYDVLHAVETGLILNKQPKLKQYIINEFNWDNCLRELYSGYLSLT